MEGWMMIQALPGVAIALSLLLVVRGLWLIQRANAAEEDVLQVNAVVREIVHIGWFSSQVMLTLPLEDLVLHVPCRVPRGRLAGGKARVTDVVPVLWRRGAMEAVALQTIRIGQVMLVTGFAAMMCTALAWVMLF